MKYNSSLHTPNSSLKSQAGVDICGNIPDVVLHVAVSVFQSDFYLADGVQYGRMVPAEFLADVRQAQVGELADQVHGHLPGFGGTLVFLGAPEDGFVHVVELADLGDDEARGGQGVALALEHIVNGPGDVGKIQRHIVQVPVGKDFLHRALNLPDVTGDIHGEVFRVAEAVDRFKITAEDVIVILGDVGMNYFGNNHGDRHRKKKLNKLGVPIFCIHGNHEMRPETIETYHEEKWHGGTVYVEDEYPNLLFAKEGEVYDLDGQKTIVIGGAYSVDKWYRLRMDMNWFSDEQPSAEIKARVERKLEDLSWKVDVVLSHTCPEQYMPVEAFLSGIDQSTVDNSTEEWLGMIEKKLEYKAWYCGHWHINKRIDRVHFLFDAYEGI